MYNLTGYLIIFSYMLACVYFGIEGAEICGNADTVAAWLDEPLERADFSFHWIQDDDPGLVAVHFSTPHGTVRID
jgi:hypothetical protein